jgi:hypothetical protein
LFGLFFGYNLYKDYELKKNIHTTSKSKEVLTVPVKIKKNLNMFAIFFVSIIFHIVSLSFGQVSRFPYERDFSRWPPSISFLNFGLMCFLLLHLIFQFLNLYKNKIHIDGFFDKPIMMTKNYLKYFSKNTFDIFVIHTILLFFAKYFLKIRIKSATVLFFTYLLLILASSIVISIKKLFFPVKRKV